MTSNTAAVAAVIVHHKNFPAVLATVEDVVATGLDPTSVLVVDNSEDQELALALASALPKGVRTRFTANRGYAAAVNMGLDFADAMSAEFIFVLTHEVRLVAGCLDELLEAIRLAPELAVVAPVLTHEGTAAAADVVWSSGGLITGPLRLPRHVQSHANTDDATHYCDWLDGAACLYRASALAGHRLSEDYFLYFEETDFHVRLADSGWRLAVVAAARASQSSAGTPPYYLGRNFVLFQRRTGTRFSRGLAFVYPLLAVGRRVARRQARPSSMRAVVRGVMDGYRVPVPRRWPAGIAK